MSTATLDNEPRTYRGHDLEELLPKIREELGPDAIVLRQRDGLDGGIGGFFQKRCVEVVARRAAKAQADQRAADEAKYQEDLANYRKAHGAPVYPSNVASGPRRS